MKCPKCGKEIAKDSIYCEYCGNKINLSGSSNNGSKKKKIFFFSLILVLLIAVVSGIFVYHKKNEAEKARILEEERLAIEAEKAAAKVKAEKEAKSEPKVDKKSMLLSKGYVDLGLPSGTLWKKNNESGYYTYEEAKKYRKELPSMDQFSELLKYSSAKWNGEGFIFNGDNGQSIFIKAAGYKYFDEGNKEVGNSIYCYTSDFWWIEGDEPSEYLCLYVNRSSGGNWEPSSPGLGYTLHLARKP